MSLNRAQKANHHLRKQSRAHRTCIYKITHVALSKSHCCWKKCRDCSTGKETGETITEATHTPELGVRAKAAPVDTRENGEIWKYDQGILTKWDRRAECTQKGVLAFK